MLSNQTLEILKSLNKQELKKFGDFVRSPYFNSISALEVVHDVVIKSAPEFNSPVLSFPKMFKKLYPSKEYKEQTIKNLYSEFGNLLRKFLSYEEMNLKKEDLDQYLVSSLVRKGLYEISNKQIQKSLHENDNGLLSAAENFRYLFDMRKNYYHDLSLLRKKDIENHIAWLNKEVEILIIFFLKNISNSKAALTEAYRLIPEENNDTLIDNFCKFFEIENFSDYLASIDHEYASYIKINYFLFYRREKALSEEEFSELKKELLKTIHKAAAWDRCEFLTQTIDFILPGLILKNNKYLNDALEFGKLFCELKIYPDESLNKLGITTFRNILTAAMNLKEYEWAENFINEYAYYLPEEVIENELNYSKGRLNFKRGNFEESLNNFNQMKLRDLIEKTNVRFYYLMNFIELKAYENAISSLQAIRQFLTDKEEIPESHSSIFLISLKYFNEIIKCEEKGEKINGLIYKEAKGTAGYYHKQYILDKMEQLK